MPGINTGPSFFSKLGAQLPGMTNALAQNYGDPALKESARNSSALLGARKKGVPSMPKPKGGLPGGMPGQMPLPTMPQMGGINTGPSQMPSFGMPMPQIRSMEMQRPTGDMGGLFGRFNRLRGGF